MELSTCPVRVLTPEVKEITRWFDATHRLTVTDAGVIWERFALPAAGGAGDQDARLMAALDWLLEVKNQLALRPKPKQQTDELSRFHRRTRGEKDA